MTNESDEKQALLDDATQVEVGRTYRRPTGVRNVFKLPVDWMTVSFMLDSPGQVDADFPKYTLASSDGAYKKTLSPKNDLVKADAYLELRFKKLLPGKTYTLTRTILDGWDEVIFNGLSYDRIVDQPRGMHDQLEAHAYAEAMELGDPAPIEDWS